ncbi:MAG: hypothetical protein MJ232_04890 [archaeon]|nr:hypothetical protein [archaeon]
MNKEEIENIKNKTKGILHILKYNKFWNYFDLLQQENIQLKEKCEFEIKCNIEFADRINKAIEFLENEYNTYPSAEEWRKALKKILRGDNNE